jgi:hypothetical protein
MEPHEVVEDGNELILSLPQPLAFLFLSHIDLLHFSHLHGFFLCHHSQHNGFNRNYHKAQACSLGIEFPGNVLIRKKEMAIVILRKKIQGSY